MANYRVVLTSSAERELKKLTLQSIARIVPRLEGLASQNVAVQKSEGAGSWRKRAHAK